jgi:hypothetical protein
MGAHSLPRWFLLATTARDDECWVLDLGEELQKSKEGMNPVL